MGVTVQRNFIFEQSVAEHLEELALFMRTSVDTALKELIEERYEGVKRKKLEAAKSARGSASGVFGNLSIQDIKASMDV